MAGFQAITKENVREKIQEAIKTWMTSDGKPPYSIEQLAVLAILATAHDMTKKEIIGWICDHFKHYRYMIASAFCESKRWDLKRLDEALAIYELPFESSREELKRGSRISYNVDFYCGLPLVQHILQEPTTPSNEATGFFTIPAELRNTIYDMVFGYGKESRLIIVKTNGKKDVDESLSLSVAYEDENPFRLGNDELGDSRGVKEIIMKPTRRYARILDRLLTCRQFRQEAMASFYRINHFCTNTLGTLHDFLSQIPSTRRAHLRHVTITYQGSDTSIAPKTFRLLGDAQYLTTLNLRIDEEGWIADRNHRIQRRSYRRAGRGLKPIAEVESALEMPGIAILTSLRGLQMVHLDGAEEAVLQAIRNDLMKPRDNANTGSGAKKRKAHKDGDTATLVKKLKKGESGEVVKKTRDKMWTIAEMNNTMRPGGFLTRGVPDDRGSDEEGS